MGAQGLPFPTSNNAPLPIPGGYGNPTGANTGGYSARSNTAFNFPAYGSPVQGAGGSGSPAYNTGPYSGTNLPNMNAGLMAYGQGYGTQLYNNLGNAYGQGAGQLLGNLLSGQLYNPQVAAAYLNAQQPGINRGMAGIQSAFGDAGARFSSAAALGMGDYESQVQLNQQQMLAQLYENAQSQELGVLRDVLPTLQAEQANKGSWMNDVVGGLETVGGIVAAPFTGGASLMATMQGLKTLSGGGGGGGGMGGGGFGLPGFGGNTGTFGANAPFDSQVQSGPSQPGYIPNYVQPSTVSLPAQSQISAGQLFTGGGDLGGGNTGVPFPMDENSLDLSSLLGWGG